MKYFSVILLAAAFCLSQAMLFDPRAECIQSADCPDTHCCVSDFRGHYCHPYQNATQPCHLPGHTFHVYHCNCKSGHTCEPIVIDPTHTNPNLTNAEHLLQMSGFGVCVATST